MQYRTAELREMTTAHAIREDYPQVIRGVRTDAAEVSARDRLDALSLVYPDAVFGGWTAAGLWGADYATGHRPMIWLPDRRKRVGITIRVGALPDADVAFACRRPVTSRVRTAVDLARFEPGDDAIAALDQCLRLDRLGQSVATVEDLREYLRSRRYLHRASRVWAALAQADGRAESPPETHLRLLLHPAGLTMFVPQVNIPEARYRVDLGAAAYRVAVEYDGEYHREKTQHTRDVARWNRLHHDHGWTIVLANSWSLGAGRVDLLRQVQLALRERGWRP